MSSKTRWESTGDLMFWSVAAFGTAGAIAEVISWWYHPLRGYALAAFGIEFVIATLMAIAYVLHVIQKRMSRADGHR